MKAIAAVDKNWAIGKDGKLLISIPEDMKFFKAATMGAIVVMGRKTLESFPGKRPLKNRTNLVLTRDKTYHPEGVSVFNCLEELKKALAALPSEEIFVIGGESIYRQLIPFCSQALITKIDKAFEADAFFPCLEKEEGWSLSSESPLKTYEGINFTFQAYSNSKVKSLV